MAAPPTRGPPGPSARACHSHTPSESPLTAVGLRDTARPSCPSYTVYACRQISQESSLPSASPGRPWTQSVASGKKGWDGEMCRHRGQTAACGNIELGPTGNWRW